MEKHIASPVSGIGCPVFRQTLFSCWHSHFCWILKSRHVLLVIFFGLVDHLPWDFHIIISLLISWRILIHVSLLSVSSIPRRYQRFPHIFSLDIPLYPLVIKDSLFKEYTIQCEEGLIEMPIEFGDFPANHIKLPECNYCIYVCTTIYCKYR